MKNSQSDPPSQNLTKQNLFRKPSWLGPRIHIVCFCLFCHCTNCVCVRTRVFFFFCCCFFLKLLKAFRMLIYQGRFSDRLLGRAAPHNLCLSKFCAKLSKLKRGGYIKVNNYFHFQLFLLVFVFLFLSEATLSSLLISCLILRFAL